MFRLLDQMAQQYFKFYYQPGQENLTDYPTKHHSSAIRQHVRPYYVYIKIFQKKLPKASKPSSRQGCAEILGDPYLQQVSLPLIPDYHGPSVDTESLPRTPKYYVAYTVWLNPSQLVLLDGKTPFSTARHQ